MSDELLDVLDEHGNATSQTATPEEAHIKGLWHRAVHIFIVNAREEVLIQQRAGSKNNHPGEWDATHGGHLHAGESTLDGAVRELHEELGLAVSAADLTQLFELIYRSQRAGRIKNELNPVFLLRIDQTEDHFLFNDREVSAVRWISIDTLETMAANGDILSRDDEISRVLSYLRSES